MILMDRDLMFAGSYLSVHWRYTAKPDYMSALSDFPSGAVRVEAGWRSAKFFVSFVVLILLVWPACLRANFTYTTYAGGAYINRYTGPGGSVTVPASVAGLPVVSVDSAVFSNRTDITDVTLPEGLVNLSSAAFKGCSNLRSVYLPSTVTKEFDAGWFEGCVALATVGISAVDTRYAVLDGVIFNSGRTTLLYFPPARSGLSYTLPDSVTQIAFRAFADGRVVESVIVPAGLKTIGVGAFYSNESIRSINLPAGLTSIGASSFSQAKNLATLSVPAGVTSIGAAAFQGCRSLTSLSWPAGVTQIPTYALANCVSLASVTLPSAVQRIESMAFSGCSSLSAITFPAALTFIGANAFENCDSLVSLSLPSNLVTVESRAFTQCDKLEQVSLPASLLQLGQLVFFECPKLQGITVAAGNPVYSSLNGVLFDKARTALIHFPAAKSGAYTVPSTVTGIASYGFYKATGLTSVTIPGSVDTINSLAFAGCVNLTSASFSAGLRVIDSVAFDGAVALRSVHLPSSLNYIGEGAFAGCTNLIQITVDSANAGFKAVDGVLFSKAGDKLLQYPGGKSGAYVVPAGVTMLAGPVFRGAVGLTDLRVNDSVALFGSDEVFKGCVSLSSIHLPAAINNFYASMLASCSSLASITVDPANSTMQSIDGVLYWRSPFSLMLYPPMHAGGVYSTPDGLQKIYAGAFTGATQLHTILVGDDVNEIGAGLFAAASNLRRVVFAGNAPSQSGVGEPFYANADSLVGFYRLSGASGYGAGVWSQASVAALPTTRARIGWLMDRGIAPETDMNASPADGRHTLLTCYAFGLEPQDHTSPLSAPRLEDGDLKIDFFGGREDIVYRVESSDDLINWSEDGVETIVHQDGLMRMAKTRLSSPVKFMRVRIDP